MFIISCHNSQARHRRRRTRQTNKIPTMRYNPIQSDSELISGSPMSSPRIPAPIDTLDSPISGDKEPLREPLTASGTHPDGVLLEPAALPSKTAFSRFRRSASIPVRIHNDVCSLIFFLKTHEQNF